jgi:hypothetical protein
MSAATSHHRGVKSRNTFCERRGESPWPSDNEVTKRSTVSAQRQPPLVCSRLGEHLYDRARRFAAARRGCHKKPEHHQPPTPVRPKTDSFASAAQPAKAASTSTVEAAEGGVFMPEPRTKYLLPKVKTHDPNIYTTIEG